VARPPAFLLRMMLFRRLLVRKLSLIIVGTALLLLVSGNGAHAWSLLSPSSSDHRNHDTFQLVLTRRATLERSVATATASTGALSFFFGSTEPAAAALAATAAAPASSKSVVPVGYDEISRRLSADTLTQIPAALPSNNGLDNTVYPDWLQGTWQVTQTLVGVDTPLGLAYAGGPNGVESIAEKSLAESRSQLNRPVQLQLRYVATPPVGGGGSGTVVEDRLFNTRQRLDAFAGRRVVSAVDYADTRASNRAAWEAATGGRSDSNNAVIPLTTTLVRFQGPAVQKTFVTAHHSNRVESGYDDDASSSDSTAGSRWAGFECQRSIFALTNQSTAPPITTDSELVFSYERIDNKEGDQVVRGRLRIAGYLNPNDDKLYFQARNRAVILQDYTLDLRRVFM